MRSPCVRSNAAAPGQLPAATATSLLGMRRYSSHSHRDDPPIRGGKFSVTSSAVISASLVPRRCRARIRTLATTPVGRLNDWPPAGQRTEQRAFAEHAPPPWDRGRGVKVLLLIHG